LVAAIGKLRFNQTSAARIAGCLAGTTDFRQTRLRQARKEMANLKTSVQRYFGPFIRKRRYPCVAQKENGNEIPG
jgi:hypothetical protein